MPFCSSVVGMSCPESSELLFWVGSWLGSTDMEDSPWRTDHQCFAISLWMECRFLEVASRPCIICPCPFYPASSLTSSSVPLNSALTSVLLLSLSTVSAFPKGLGLSTPSAWSTVPSSLSNSSSLFRSHMKHCSPGEPSLPSAWLRASCKPRSLPLCVHIKVVCSPLFVWTYD